MGVKCPVPSVQLLISVFTTVLVFAVLEADIEKYPVAVFILRADQSQIRVRFRGCSEDSRCSWNRINVNYFGPNDAGHITLLIPAMRLWSNSLYIAA